MRVTNLYYKKNIMLRVVLQMKIFSYFLFRYFGRWFKAWTVKLNCVDVSGLNDMGKKIRFLSNPFVEREAESNPFALTLNSDVT